MYAQILAEKWDVKKKKKKAKFLQTYRASRHRFPKHGLRGGQEVPMDLDKINASWEMTQKTESLLAQLERAYSQRFALKFDPNQPRDEQGKWVAIGVAINKLMKHFGVDWMAALTKLHQAGAMEDLLSGRLDVAQLVKMPKYAHILKFDPSQPRDTHGRWTRVGTRLSALVSKVRVAEGSTTTRAAEAVAKVLERMKAKGFRMPDSVDVTTAMSSPIGRGNAPAAILTKVPAQSGSRTLLVTLPDTLPEDANLDHAVQAAFAWVDGGKRYAARTMQDVIVHAMSDVLTPGASKPFKAEDLGFSSEADMKKTMEKVSLYAGTGMREFIAETFVRLYRGDALPKQVMRLYDAVGGPRIPRLPKTPKTPRVSS